MKVKNAEHFNVYDSSTDTKSKLTISLEDIAKILGATEDNASNKACLYKTSILLMEKNFEKSGFPYLNMKKIKELGLDQDSKYLEYKKKKEDYKLLKNTFQNVIFDSYSTKGTAKSDVEEYNNHIIIDIDDLDEDSLNLYFKSLSKDDYVKFLFISPGTAGLKILFQVDYPTDNETTLIDIDNFHNYSYGKICKYLQDTYQLKIDGSGKNLGRRCFISTGRAYHLNLKCKVFLSYSDYKNNLLVKKTTIGYNLGSSNKALNPVIDKMVTYLNQTGEAPFTEYHDWVKLGFALYAQLPNESGLEAFKALSKNSPNYNEQACSNFWKSAAKSFNPDRAASIKWVVMKLQEHGLVIKSNCPIFTKKFKWAEVDFKLILKDLKYEIIRDELSNVRYLIKEGKTIRLTDSEMSQLITDILRYNNSMSVQKLELHLNASSNTRPVNFIRDKMDSILTSDSTDFENMFKYIGTEEGDDITKRIITRWMLGCMKKFHTDSLYDEILCLKGGQGLGKTTFITEYFLSPFKEWLNQNFNWKIDKPDDVRPLHTMLFIYDSENSALSKSHAANIKKITSMKEVTYRKSYGREDQSYKLIANFITDTNEEIIFNDDTGGRRFLILSLESLNIYDKDGGELKKLNYNNVWGYIYHLFKQGIRPESIEVNELLELREKSRLKSDLEICINDLLVADPKGSMTYDDILSQIRLYYTKRGHVLNEGSYSRQNIGRHLKFKKSLKYVDGKRTQVYHCSLLDNHLKRSLFQDPKFKDKSEVEAELQDNFIDDILKKKMSGIEPSPAELETLKKLNRK